MNINYNDGNNESPKEELVWYNNLSEALEVAESINRPIFIDFTGYTCTNCRWMETNVFVDSQVMELFNHFILVQLFTDGGPNYRDNQNLTLQISLGIGI